MKKIRVCHVVSGLKSGGVEMVIYNYCSKMNSEQYEWHLLYQHEPSIKNIDEFKKLNFKLQRVSSKVKHPIRNYLETYNYFKKNKIDVVHCHMTLMNFIPLIAAKKLGIKKRISHSHEARKKSKNIIKELLFWIFKKITTKTANIKLACGEEAGKYLYSNRKFEILHNAIDLEKYEFNKNKREEIRKLHKIKDNEIVIGNIGRFSEVKNHMFLLEIFKDLVNIDNKYRLLLIGDGELKDKIIQKIDELKIKDKVILTGIINNANEYYNIMDFFVLPSFFEGLPVSGIEAQKSGLTCLFCNTIDKKVQVIENNTFLLPLKKEQWIKKITELRILTKKKTRKVDEQKFTDKGLNLQYEIKKLDLLYKS